jgi:predicted lipoprotein with Yx(FWY)xxD motif
MKRALLAVAIPALLVTAVHGTGTSAAASVHSAAASTAKVELQKTNLGKVLTDGHGRTLYLFEKDKRGGRKSTCFGQCATAWPPLTTTRKPVAGRGVSASKLGTIKRGNGVKQVTYNGWPLYRFEGDTAARQTNGEGLKAFGAEWYVLNAAGKKVDEDGS